MIRRADTKGRKCHLPRCMRVFICGRSTQNVRLRIYESRMIKRQHLIKGYHQFHARGLVRPHFPAHAIVDTSRVLAALRSSGLVPVFACLTRRHSPTHVRTCSHLTLVIFKRQPPASTASPPHECCLVIEQYSTTTQLISSEEHRRWHFISM
jgi:hypothetical protein